MTCKNYIEYILEVCKTLKLKCPLKGNSIIKSTFRTAIKKLSEKLQPQVYELGFLKA